jgi:hypothetical protein
MAGDLEHEKVKQRRSFLPIFWISLVLFIIYPLNSGPVFRVVEDGKLPEGTYVMYLPLADIVGHSPQLQKYFRWYLRDVWKWGPECTQNPDPFGFF